MARCGVCLDERLAAYGFGQAHPFGNDRFYAFADEFRARGLADDVDLFPAQAGDTELLELFHTPAYVSRLKEVSAHGVGYLDQGDTPVFPGIFEASALVAGTVHAAMNKLLAGEYEAAFVPIAGLHHARRDGAAGFCAVNDCGIAIEALQRAGCERVLYVDIDAHHGDGVFYAFEEDPSLVVVDFHEDGRFLYPGTGRADETGRGAARGTKINVPLPPRANDALFETLWPSALRFIRTRRPDFVILQAGADSIAGDPITHLQLSPAIHHRVAADLMALGAPLLALGGGGYHRPNLAAAWCEVVAALRGNAD